ncbi:pre-mRNA-splicing factor CWC22 homolog [Solanum tuberosum]|uniref:pre-mRNA-splicing factor CWC22 homolog n=1 Tax=Solanum tuberosum TaxID=4113 RepID=UPI00073A0B2E|nr:PREDICTED: pre-mRNA-splicing factor CWC22 homolog [Solanum tuberosum]
MEKDLSENRHRRRRNDEDVKKVERQRHRDRSSSDDDDDERGDSRARRRVIERENGDDGRGDRRARRRTIEHESGDDDGGGGNNGRDDRRLSRRRTERGTRDDSDDGSKRKSQRDEREDSAERGDRRSKEEQEEEDDDGDRDKTRERRRKSERVDDDEKDDRRERRRRNDREDDAGRDDRRQRRPKDGSEEDDERRDGRKESRKNVSQVDEDVERDDRSRRKRRHEGEAGDVKDDRKEMSRRNGDERNDRKEKKQRESDDEKVQKRREGRVERYNYGREGDRKEKRRNVEREKKDDGDDHDRKDTRQRVGADKHGKEKNREDNTQEDGALKASEVSKVQKQDGNLNVDTAKLGRSGGVYIPPFKLARMMKEVQDKSSVEYQRMTWDALRKSINGLVNKVNAANLKNIIPELFAENLIRGRGLFCRSCMKSQMASPGFTDVFAALVAVVNTKFPEVGDLLLRRIILQLQRAYKRNDKPQLLAAVKFIAHLVNQQIVHELIALELLTVLLEKPTDDSVEVAVGFVTECGSMLQDLCPRGLHGIFERFRGILHEGEIDKRVQFLIESLFALRKAKFQGYQAVRPELDLVEQEDQLTHEVSLSDTIDPEITLGMSVLPANSSSLGTSITTEIWVEILKLNLCVCSGNVIEKNMQMELCIMLLECCSQERTYLRYYGLLGQRFCMINKIHQENFEKCFVQQYSMIHRLETNKLRNVAKFFAHLLGTDALPWHALAYIRLTEEDTTSSSRIFIKILFQEMSEHLGIRLLNERLNDPTMNTTR